MLARSWATSAVRIGATVLATAAATAIVVAPTAQSETSDAPVTSVSPAPESTAPELAEVVPTRPATVAADRLSFVERADRTTRSARSRQVITARQVAFRDFTLTSDLTTDMRGVEPSLYRGRFFHPEAEERRLCIVRRESEGHYDVVNPGGNYFGAYQVSRALAEGVTYMMADEHKDLMGQARAKELLAELRSTPMHRWPRYWQDAAFHTIMNWEHPLSGAAHWAGGRWHC